MFKTIKKRYDSGIIPLPIALSGGIAQVCEHIHKYIEHLDFFASLILPVSIFLIDNAGSPLQTLYQSTALNSFG